MELVNRLARSKALRGARVRAGRLVSTLDRRLAGPIGWPAACAAVFALQAALILTHTPWLDEIQAVQLAIEAPDVPTLLAWLRYEGHPPLWYFILRGLGYLMDPLATLPAAAQSPAPAPAR